MLQQEFTKLSLAKKGIRKAIQRKRTGLTLEERFETYPPYIAGMHSEQSTIDDSGLVDYCEDGTSTFTIPNEITTIRDYAFYDYTALKNLVITSTTLITLDGTHAFDRTLIEKGIGKIYVPASLVNTYKAATNWSKFASQIVSGTPEAEITTNLIEHEADVRTRTVEWFNALKIEDIITDRRI